MGNIDFNGHIDDENRRQHEASEELYCFEDYLTVRALLGMHFGERVGNDIYNLLERMGTKVATEMGGTPGILFNESGGEFVSFDNDPPDDEGDDEPFEGPNDFENWDA
jgi:hypothetical protein